MHWAKKWIIKTTDVVSLFQKAIIRWSYQLNKYIASHQMPAPLLPGFPTYMKHTVKKINNRSSWFHSWDRASFVYGLASQTDQAICISHSCSNGLLKRIFFINITFSWKLHVSNNMVRGIIFFLLVMSYSCINVCLSGEKYHVREDNFGFFRGTGGYLLPRFCWLQEFKAWMPSWHGTPLVYVQA
jgi:hypothetical protein